MQRMGYWYLAIFVSVFFIITAAYAAFVFFQTEVQDRVRLSSTSGDAARPLIEETIGGPLPESAADLHFGRQGLVNPSYWIRLQTTLDDVGVLLQNADFMCFQDVPPATFEPTDFLLAPGDESLDWWNPPSVATGRELGGACVSPVDGALQGILVTLPEPNLAVVYISLTRHTQSDT